MSDTDQEIHPSIKFTRVGTDRNDSNATEHTYAETDDGIFPMCRYGWNRSNGRAFSIFRGPPGSQGSCRLCAKRLNSGKPPVVEGSNHRTRYI